MQFKHQIKFNNGSRIEFKELESQTVTRHLSNNHLFVCNKYDEKLNNLSKAARDASVAVIEFGLHMGELSRYLYESQKQTVESIKQQLKTVVENDYNPYKQTIMSYQCKEIDTEYLKKLSETSCQSFSSQMLVTGRSYSKKEMVEAECVSRIERLHKEAEITGIKPQYIKDTYRKAAKYYRENITRTDFLHTYEDFLTQAIRYYRQTQGLTISIINTLKMKEIDRKREYYLSRDWIGANKLFKRKK